MIEMPPTWAQVAYLVAAICFILALKGLSSPKTARRGNLIGAAGAALAVLTVLVSGKLDHLLPIAIAMIIGIAVGALGAYRVKMTQMPQLVALFNGVGGGAAAIVALVELHEISSGAPASVFHLIATALTIIIGSVSFTGSIVTFLKLQELMTTRPVTSPATRSCTASPWSRRSASPSSWPSSRPWWRASRWPSSGPGWACCWCCRSAARTCRSSSRC